MVNFCIDATDRCKRTSGTGCIKAREVPRRLRTLDLRIGIVEQNQVEMEQRGGGEEEKRQMSPRADTTIASSKQ